MLSHVVTEFSFSVEHTGLEPATPCLQSRCATIAPMPHTRQDLRIVLSQRLYIPSRVLRDSGVILFPGTYTLRQGIYIPAAIGC